MSTPGLACLLWLTLAAGAFGGSGSESCCWNGTEVKNSKLCYWLQATGVYYLNNQSFSKIAGPCSPTYCFQSPAMTWLPPLVHGNLTLQECWNLNASETSLAAFCSEGANCQPLWNGALYLTPATTRCCFVGANFSSSQSHKEGQKLLCAPNPMTPVECAQQYNGIAAASCQQCQSLGACVTGASRCLDTQLSDCQLQPTATGYLDGSYYGLGGWFPGTSCDELLVNESLWSLWTEPDCYGATISASYRIAQPFNTTEFYGTWNLTVLLEGLPFWWFPQFPETVLPIECVDLTAGGLLAPPMIDGRPYQGLRFIPTKAWYELYFFWVLPWPLLLSLFYLACAAVVEWRWRWLRRNNQPTALLVRKLAVYFWLVVPATALAPSLLRAHLGGTTAWGMLAVAAWVTLIFSDFAFVVFLTSFAHAIQSGSPFCLVLKIFYRLLFSSIICLQLERTAYTKQRWSRKRFILTLILPSAVMFAVSLSFVLIWIFLYRAPRSVQAAFMGVLALATIPSIVLAVQLARLVRYTMRVLPFRSTRVLATWVSLSGLAFLATHAGYLQLEQQYMLPHATRTLYGFLIVLCVTPLPLVSVGWAALLWPPLSHSVGMASLPLIADQEGYTPS